MKIASVIAFALLSILTPGISGDQKVEAPAKATVSDQLGKVIWSKDLINLNRTRERIWISAHRPTTGGVTLIHEHTYTPGTLPGTKVWATYDLAPGETIHICAAGSNTNLVIVSETVPKGAVKVTATEQ